MPVRYRIEIKKSAAKEIRAITRKRVRQRVVDRIGALAADPRPPGCTKLTGQEAFRIRQGSYRIGYTVTDDVLVVHVLKVRNRMDVYR